jgi:hypothetical protein
LIITGLGRNVKPFFDVLGLVAKSDLRALPYGLPGLDSGIADSQDWVKLKVA